jgi:hypothetical protein
LVCAGSGEIERDIDDHVLAAADHFATAEFHQQRDGIEPVKLGCPLRVEQKAGIDARVPQRQCSRSTRTGRCCSGRARSSAASSSANRLHPVSYWPGASRSSAATKASIGVLPAPVPMPAREPSTRVAPCAMATRGLATPKARLWWIGKTFCVAISSRPSYTIRYGTVSYREGRRHLTERLWVPKHNPWLIAITVSMATFMKVLDPSVANVSLPRTRDRLERSLRSIQNQSSEGTTDA